MYDAQQHHNPQKPRLSLSTDEKMLKSHKGDSQATTLLEKQLKRHTNDIIEYVTSDSFQVALNNLNL